MPAVNRVKKIMRNLEGFRSIVMTTEPRCYPSFVETAANSTETHGNETIYRIPTSWNLHALLLRVKQAIAKAVNCFKPSPDQRTTPETPQPPQDRPTPSASIKELLDQLLLFPDFARPWLFPAVRKGYTVIKREKPDIILATGTPWTALIVGALLKSFSSAKLITDFRDPWSENPYVTTHPLVQKLDSLMERFVVQRSDLVFLNTTHLLNAFIKRYPRHQHKLICVTNGYDSTDFENISTQELPHDHLNLLHAGTLYAKRDPGMLLQALAKHNKQQSMQANFYQIGKIDVDYDLPARCAELNIQENFTTLPFMPHKDCLGYMQAADVLVLIQPDTKTQIPSKLYEYIYFNKPVLAICEEDSALAKMIEDHRFGIVFSPHDIEGASRYLNEICLLKKKKKRLVMDYDIGTFDFENIISSIRHRIEQL